MTRSVLVGFDGSEHARDALALGELLARPPNAHLTAACVYVFHPIHRQGDAEFEAVLREEARRQVAVATEHARDRELELRVMRGHSAATGLHDLAVETGAELIVIGSSRHGALGRVMARGLPERLMHDAPCAVAVAPRGYAAHRPGRLTTIGVGFDGKAESRSALQRATDIARETDARLEVIASLDPTFEPSTRRARDVQRRLGFDVALRQQRRNALGEAVAGLEGVDATPVTAEGPASGALCARSPDLDLLVLGSRHSGRVRRVLLGSVSTQVVHRADCPVLVVPRGDATQDEAERSETETSAGRPA